MKRVMTFLLFFITSYTFACENKAHEELPTHAKVHKDSYGNEADVFVYYPKVFDGALVSSINIAYVQNDKKFVSVNATMLEKLNPEDHKVDTEKYNASLLSLDMDLLNHVRIIVRYTYPPLPDGSVMMCSPSMHFDLKDIIQ